MALKEAACMRFIQQGAVVGDSSRINKASLNEAAG